MTSADDPNLPAADHLALRMEARRQPRTPRRLLDLVRQSIRIAVRADRRLFMGTLGLQLLGSLVLAGQVLVVKWVLDGLLALTDGGDVAAAIVVPIALLAGATALAAGSSALEANAQRLLGELVTRDTWQQLLDVTARVDLVTFETDDFFDRLERVETNALIRPYSLVRGLVGLAGGILGGVGLGIAILALEPVLVPLLLLAGVPMFLAGRRESQLEFDFTVAQTPLLRRLAYLAQVQVGRDEAKELRAFGSAAALRGDFDHVYGDVVTGLSGHLRRRSRLAVVGNLGGAVFLAATLLALVWLVDVGRVDLAGAGAAVVAIRLLSGQLSTIVRSMQQVFEAGLFMTDLNEFVAIGEAAAAGGPATPAPADFDILEVRDVTFRYPDSEHDAVHGASLRLRRGEIVALVGENGSGKTTLAKMLAALYAPTSGSISWDGQDLADMDPASVRRAVAVIFQDFVEYELRVADNIGLGQPERRDDRAGIIAAAEQAGVSATIEALSKGYDTILSPEYRDGTDLSGGQWQRVALARAFFRDAPFVILDEPTSALDPRAEHRLFTSLRGLVEGRTVLFISHRFATVRTADRICVMEGGRITEQGTHEELMTLDGHYADLFRLQAGAYLDPRSST